MTAHDFRSDGDRVLELREVLGHPTLQQALLVVHDGKAIEDAKEDAAELASVRRLSNLAGRAEMLRELYLLATPISDDDRTFPTPNFGVTEAPPEGWTPL